MNIIEQARASDTSYSQPNIITCTELLNDRPTQEEDDFWLGEGWCAGEFESFGELASESRNAGFDLDGLD